MNKESLFRIIGDNRGIVENDNGTALVVNIESDELKVIVTIPYDVNEIYYEAINSQGVVLIKDWSDYYGEFEEDDFQEDLMDIVDVLRKPIIRLSDDGKYVEAFGYRWYYFFGEYRI